MFDAAQKIVRKPVGKYLNQRSILFNLRQLSFITSHPTDNPSFCALKKPKNPNKLRITWVIPPFIAGGGGHTTIFRVVQHLSRQGHQQRMLIFDWLGNTDLRAAKELLKNSFFDTGAELDMFDWDRDEETDVLIATSWHTAYGVAWLKNAAAKLYFVQDMENQHFAVGDESLLAENTYRFGFPAVTAGPWLADKLGRDYGLKADSFPLAYDPSEYHMLDEPRQKQVACYVRPGTPRRGFDLAVIALRRFQQQHPDWTVGLYGASDLPAIPGLNYTDHGVLSHAELNKLYNRSSIGLVISGTNYSLIPLEMMGAGLPVVDIAAENNFHIYGQRPDFIHLADPSPEGIAAGLNTLTDNPTAKAQSDKATNYARKLSWNESCTKAEEIILRFSRS